MHYFNPVEISFGSQVRKSLIDKCIGKNTLIVCSKNARKRYSEDPYLKNLFQYSNVKFEHGFDNNPSLLQLIKIIDNYKDVNLDLIIGLGGGSAMDVAKILSVSIPANQKGIEFKELLENNNLFENFQAIDCIHVPTTAGTGSEVTPFATVWDYENQRKRSLSHHAMYAKKAFIDPDFLVEIPLDVAVSTGLDALNQAFESLWNRNASDLTIAFSIRAAVLALQGLPIINQIPNNSNARKILCKASLLSGLAISQTRTSICHSISYPLTINFGIEHGLACCFSMLEVYAFNKSFIKNNIDKIGLYLGKDPYIAIEEIFQQHEIQLKLKSALPEWDIFKELSEEFVTEGRFENNIKTCDEKELLKILKASHDRIFQL